MNAILGEKLGMTQILGSNGAISVTVVKAGPCRVVQVKTPERDGYSAVQLGFGDLPPRLLTKPAAGHFKAANLPPYRHLVEVRVTDSSLYRPGQEIKVGEVLEKGMKADVGGVGKGKGFSGVMKRHNFAGQGDSHGNHRMHRAMGSIGAGTTPGRTVKGLKMPGRMGGKRVTVLSLEVVEVDAEQDLIMLAGSVPGNRGALVMVRKAVKGG